MTSTNAVVALTSTYRNFASERPTGRYDLAGVQGRPGAFTVFVWIVSAMTVQKL